MSNVREVIELLCKVLVSNGTSKIKAELFRLAKFDQNEAAAPLWKLLFELLYFLEHGVIDEVVIKAYNELTLEEQVVYIKRCMQEKGFVCKEFSCLPNGMSSGSRELVLAFAWLLGTQGIVDKFMENCTSPLSSDFPEHKKVYLDPRSNRSTQNLTPVEKVQQLQHLNGKLHMSLKRLHSLQRERAKLQHKVHESTYGASTFPDKTHLSVLEVHLLRHPDYLKKLQKLLDKDNIRLQNMLLWKEKEDIFWKWMESVLDLKIQEKRDEDKGEMMLYNVPPNLLERLSSERSRLEAAIMKYETIIEEIEEIWDSKVKDISQSELDRLLWVIDMELAFYKANLGHEKSNTAISKYRDPQFLLVKPGCKKTSSIQRVENVAGKLGDSLVETFDIEEEILQMEALIERLELQAKYKEACYRQKLDRLASKIPESVCIQPASLM